MGQPPPDAIFVGNPNIKSQSSAPEEIRASEDDYSPESGSDVCPSEIAEEGGPDGSTYSDGCPMGGRCSRDLPGR